MKIITQVTTRFLTLMMLLLFFQTMPVAKTVSHTSQQTSENPSAEQAKVEIPPRISQLLEASGYNVAKVSDNVWSIQFQGKSLAQFKVFLVYVNDTLVSLVRLAEKKNIKATPELWQKLLHYNHEIDRVKILLNDEGDLALRIESNPRLLDVQEFMANIEQLAAATDKVYAGIKQFLIAEKSEN